MITQIIILCILLLGIPTVIGTFFVNEEKGMHKLLLSWVSGQVLLWAVFLLISVPLILKQQMFSDVKNWYNLAIGGCAGAAILFAVYRRRKRKSLADIHLLSEAVSGGRIALWIIFAVVLLIQIMLGVCLAYEEGDDAFYVAISTATESTEYMYRTLPYSGLTTQLDARHGLAPFPVWIAYLARMSGMVTATMAQIVVPIVILLITYAIYYLLARQLFRDKQGSIPFFMILVELMVMFGGYSLYSAENFLLVRASQGKAVIANVILPFMVYLFFLLAESQQEKRRFGISRWILLGATLMAGCLCSTLGTLLTVMMLGVIGLCIVICYRNWKLLFPLASCCIVPGGLALLYFLIR